MNECSLREKYRENEKQRLARYTPPPGIPYHAFYQPFSSFRYRFPFFVWKTVLSTCNESEKLASIRAPERRIAGLWSEDIRLISLTAQLTAGRTCTSMFRHVSYS